MATNTQNSLVGSLSGLVFRIVALGVIDAFAVWFVIQLLGNNAYLFAFFVAAITIGVNAFFLSDKLYAYRWFAPGLTLMILMIVYPTVYTVYAAFTNYRDGNILTRPQLEKRLSSELYLPADTTTYSWTAFETTDEPKKYGLWLIPSEGMAGEPLFVEEGKVTLAADMDLGEFELDEEGVPEGLPGFELVRRGRAIGVLLPTLRAISFGEGEDIYQFSTDRPQDFAAKLLPRFEFQDNGSILDKATDTVYTVNEGSFYAPDGTAAPPPITGYYVVTGVDNFQRLFEDNRIREPFFRVFIWTVTYAFLSVFLTFWFGLFMAIILNADFMPGRAIFRTMLLVPYTIPAFVTVLVWRGLLNEELGVVNKALDDTLGWAPNWFSDRYWAKAGILLIQLWLGFPYMMLICSGALQSIPKDIYSAAEVDGASAFQRFRNLTLPLLLVAVGPLLIASFAYNFNNFTLIEYYNEGNPPIPGGGVAGHTDILITYTYALAFGSGRGADYAFASTISIMIFILVATITVFNFRFTRQWEEISENV